MNYSSRIILIRALVAICLAFPTLARAVDPPPDGGYPNRNTAEGEDALLSLTTGADNTALGFHALHNITDSSQNTAVGANALANTTAGPNTAIGADALSANTTGFNNTAVSGLLANTTGHDSSGVQVVINSKGQLGTVTSSARYKRAIKPMASSSEVIYSLHPVTYRYKNTLDPAGVPQFGLVAEQVAKVLPELVAYDKEGKPYSVRYQAVNAMLLNEFQKGTQKAEAQDTALQTHEEELDRLETRIAKLEAGLAN